MISCFSHVPLFATPWTATHQAPLSMGFSRQEYWSSLPCPPPGDLSDPGMEPTSPVSPALPGRFFTTSATSLINKCLLNAYWFQALVCVCTQSCLTLYDPMDYSPPGYSAQGTFQARILEWIAISSSSGFSWPRAPTHLSCGSCIGRQILYHCAT